MEIRILRLAIILTAFMLPGSLGVLIPLTLIMLSYIR